MEINFNYFLGLSTVVFFIGLLGCFAIRKNLILILVSFELLLLASNLNLLFSSILFDDLIGQIFSLLVLIIAAAESAVGLSFMVAYYKLRGLISVDFIDGLKG